MSLLFEEKEIGKPVDVLVLAWMICSLEDSSEDLMETDHSEILSDMFGGSRRYTGLDIASKRICTHQSFIYVSMARRLELTIRRILKW